MIRAFAKGLAEIAESDQRVILMTAEPGSDALTHFAEAFPSRFIKVGVSEANMVGVATGVAACGYIPYVHTLATKTTMGPYGQLRNGPIRYSLPVRIIGEGGGFEDSSDGGTCPALEDLGIARVQPELTVIAPADHRQAAKAVSDTYDLPGPIYYRLGMGDDDEIPELEGRFTLGKAEIIRDGEDVLILSAGSITLEAVEAADRLSEAGMESTVAVVASLRPAPADDLRELLANFEVAATVEEHYLDGGLGSLAAEIIADHGIECRLIRCGIKSLSSAPGGSDTYLRERHGLSARGLFRTILERL